MRRLRYTTLLPPLALALAGAPATLHAQPEEDLFDLPLEALEHLVVIARKRAEPLQSTPVAVTALTGESLDRIFATDLTDLNARAPNVTMQPLAAFPSSAAVFIRGIGNSDIDSSIDPPVAIFVDGVYIPRPANTALDVFDIEQVEVLRGPQGTLFGRNTTGGAVHFRTRRPTGELGTRGSITVGRYGRRDIRVAAEAPLVEGRLAAKVSVFSQELDGYYQNTFSGLPGQRGARDAGGTDSLNIRPTLHFTPTETFELTVIGEYLRERSDMTPGINVSQPTQVLQIAYAPEAFATGEEVRTLEFNVPGAIENDIWGVTVEANWEVWGGTLTSVSNYRDTDSVLSSDIDFTFAPAFEILRDEPHEQWSTELRFAKDFTDKLHLTTGLYYFEQDYFLRRDTFLDLTNTGTTTHINAITGQQHTDFAIFAEGDYYLTSKLRVTVGGRYTREEKDFEATLFSPFPTLSQLFELDDEWSNFGPKVGVDYELTDNAMVYASYSRGFKSGGFNGRGGTAGALGPFNEEVVDAFEVGMKADWLDDRLRTNVALFHNDYDDLQRTIIRNLPPPAANPQETITANAATATINGVELELVALPLESLQLNLAVGYTDAEYDDFFADLTGSGTEVDNSGIPLQRAPEWTVAAGVTWEAQLGQYGSATFRVDFTHVSNLNNHVAGAPAGKIDGYDVWDLSATWRDPGERFHASFYVKNVGDEVYQSSVTLVGALFDTNYISAPRRWGLELGWDF